MAAAAGSDPESHRGTVRSGLEIHNGGRGRSAKEGTVNAIFVGERPMERLKAKST